MAASQKENKVNHHILYKKSIKSNSSVFLGIYSTKCRQTTNQKTTTKEKTTLLPEAQICFKAHSILVETSNTQCANYIPKKQNLGQTSNQI